MAKKKQPAPEPRHRGKQFACTVDGKSMSPKYDDGDIALFSVEAVEHEGIIDGANYFIQFQDGTNTFKRIYLHKNPKLLILQGWNDTYPARVIERAKVKLLARAIYKIVPDEAGKVDHHAK